MQKSVLCARYRVEYSFHSVITWFYLITFHLPDKHTRRSHYFLVASGFHPRQSFDCKSTLGRKSSSRNFIDSGTESIEQFQLWTAGGSFGVLRRNQWAFQFLTIWTECLNGIDQVICTSGWCTRKKTGCYVVLKPYKVLIPWIGAMLRDWLIVAFIFAILPAHNTFTGIPQKIKLDCYTVEFVVSVLCTWWITMQKFLWGFLRRIGFDIWFPRVCTTAKYMCRLKISIFNVNVSVGLCEFCFDNMTSFNTIWMQMSGI